MINFKPENTVDVNTKGSNLLNEVITKYVKLDWMDFIAFKVEHLLRNQANTKSELNMAYLKLFFHQFMANTIKNAVNNIIKCR